MFRLSGRLLRSCAALLALLLSAVGGGRIVVDRHLAPGADRGDRAIVGCADLGRPALARAAASPATSTAPAAFPPADAPLPACSRAVPAPTLLLGCALGPRAP